MMYPSIDRSIDRQQEAKVPFVISDLVIVVAMHYIDKGIAAEKKLRHTEEQHAEKNRVMDKGEKLAQRKATRQQQQQRKMPSSAGGRNQKLNNIQQPGGKR